MRLGTRDGGDHVPKFMIVRVVAALVATVLVVTACGEDSGGGGTTDSLKLYNDKGAWEQFFRDVGQLSQEEIGLGMEPVGYSDEPTYEAFIKASFRTNVKPDLFTWSTGHRLNEIVGEGVVAETTDLWTEAIANGDLTESLKPYYTIDGKQYCVPLNTAYWVMFYNKQIFDEHGLEPPSTWEDLISIADTLVENGVTPFYHTAVLFSFVWFQQLMVGSDPALYNALSEGTASYTDPGVVAVMEEWKQMIDSGYFSDPGDETDPAAQLKSGKVAMGAWGTWFNTSMTQQEMTPGEDYGMFFIPNRVPQNNQTAVLFESGPLCTLDDAPYRDESMRYLEWWVTPSAQELWSNSRGDVSGNPKVEIADPGLSEVTQAASSLDYVLYNRYFEATPAPVLTAALDAFGAFVVNPDEYQSQLETIQQANEDYWAEAGD
jgi:multiple sugar transport system substrate-binding protein